MGGGTSVRSKEERKSAKPSFEGDARSSNLAERRGIGTQRPERVSALTQTTRERDCRLQKKRTAPS